MDVGGREGANARPGKWPKLGEQKKGEGGGAESDRQNILTHETAIHLCGETKSAPVERACSLGRISES